MPPSWAYSLVTYGRIIRNAMIDDKYLEMATKIVSAAVTNPSIGTYAITQPQTVANLFKAVATEISILRYEEKTPERTK